MTMLSATRLLESWERGLTAWGPARALVLLACARPHEDVEDWLGATVGEADASLLALHECLFGRTMRGYGDCVACGERFEMTVDTRSIRMPYDRRDAVHELRTGAYSLSFRSLRCADLCRVKADWTEARALRTLLSCCVLGAHRDGQSLEAADLPREVIDVLSEQMSIEDPQAEVTLQFACASCGHEQSLLFDIVSHLWTRIDRLARRLLHEVHRLAAAYGWTERQILRMSAGRRAAYLTLLSHHLPGELA